MRIKNILQYLEDTAQRVPDKLAFSDGVGEESLTFAALLRMARSVGSALIRRGARGHRVAIVCERHPSTVALMLGVLYAGGIYVPLDTQQPFERIRLLCKRAQAALVVCDEKNEQTAQALGLAACTLEELLNAPTEDDALAAVRAAQIDTDPIYVIFTSGSTGEPKGVLGCHRAVIDYGEALTTAHVLDGQCVFGCQSPLWYDAFLKELMGALMHGATVYLVPRRLFSFPILLLRYVKDHCINTVCWVASALANVCALGALDAEPPTTLVRVAFGSELFSPAHLRRWRAALPQARFYQLYGPTEATGMSCVFAVDREFSDDERIPIGRPLDNTGVLLLGEDDRPVLEGQTGEIVLRGSCLTLGYDHDARTDEVFVQNPMHRAYPETVYRTGDLAYYNERGELVFVGRRDSQIKRMGHRIELGEIEAAAMLVSGVGSAACIYDGANQALHLFYTGHAEKEAVLSHLRATLPRHMLPARVVRLELLPRLTSGKIDRRALTLMIQED